ncbi:MAG: hypothetical protein REH83_01155 [Rickettsiella sp.]|nr:hypothetical protein [Rickettsiella sp.]
MKKDRSKVPVINLDLDEEFTKNSYKLLRELLKIFVKEKPSIQFEINEAFHSHQKQKLDDKLHKLYGSCVYCGLNRLKESIIDLKESINSDNYSEKLLKTFNEEIEYVVEEAKKI